MLGFPVAQTVKNPGLISGLGRSPGEGNGYQLQYSFLENPMNRGAWQAYSPWGHKDSDMTERLTLPLRYFRSNLGITLDWRLCFRALILGERYALVSVSKTGVGFSKFQIRTHEPVIVLGFSGSPSLWNISVFSCMGTEWDEV